MNSRPTRLFFASHRSPRACSILAVSLLASMSIAFGCDSGATKPANEPVVQDLEIETGEEFDPNAKKDK